MIKIIIVFSCLPKSKPECEVKSPFCIVIHYRKTKPIYRMREFQTEQMTVNIFVNKYFKIIF